MSKIKINLMLTYSRCQEQYTVKYHKSNKKIWLNTRIKPLMYVRRRNMYEKVVSVVRNNHNHTLQTNPRHREEEPQNIYSNYTSVRQLKQSNKLSFPLQDDCKTRMDTK